MRFAPGGLRGAIFLLLSSLGLPACGDGVASDASAGSGVTVRDSAGIRIVENHDSAWTEATRWRLADEPDLVIGSVDGSVPGTDFGRVDDVWTLEDHVVVVDGQSREIRLFGPSGSFERSFGGPGVGPEEFRFVHWTGRVGDSLVVHDSGLRKIVVFPLDGGAARVHAYGNPDTELVVGRDIVEYAMPDGGFLVASVPPFAPVDLPISDRILVTREWRRVPAPGQPGDTLGPLGSHLVYNTGSTTTSDPLVLTPIAMTALREGRFWHALPVDAFEFIRFSLDGTPAPELIVRRAWTPQPLPASFPDRVQSYYDSAFAAADLPAEIEAARRESIDAMEYVDPLPPFMSLEIGPDRDVWVNDFPAASRLTVEAVTSMGVPHSARWTVFDGDGRWLGTVQTPDGFRITEVGRSHVLGIRTDPLGVQTIERWPILKPG